MNEKTIIESKPYSFKKMISTVLKWSIAYCVLTSLYPLLFIGVEPDWALNTILLNIIIVIVVDVILIILFLQIQVFIFTVGITVTNKRVYGKTTWGRRVDLPLDSISAIGTSMFAGISVATSSGRISFFGIDNRDEVFNAISELILERQDRKNHK